MKNPIKEKSKLFAIRIINLYKHLIDKKKEFVMSKQLLRSGTSIGANSAEAMYSISEPDMMHKLYISLRECSETIYWLELLQETNYITEKEFSSIYKDAEELRKMLSSSTKTLKLKIDNKKKQNKE